jgi:hypothetical protein
VRHGHRVYLVVGCNEPCVLYAHGHLSLVRRHHHMRLRSVRTDLAAHDPTRIALSIPPRALSAVRAALRAHRRVYVLIDVEVSAAGQPWHAYVVRVRLT